MEDPYKTNTNKKAMISALEANVGIVTKACRAVGISRVTHYEWIKTDEEYKLAVDDVQEVAKDFVESNLLKAIESLHDPCIIFYAKCKMKDRGYIERNELALSGSVEVKKLSWFDPEQDEAMYKLLSEQTVPQKNGH